MTASYLCYEGTRTRIQSTVRFILLLDTETNDEEARPPAVCDSLEPALDVARAQHRAHDPPVHILLAGQIRTHRAFEDCDQELQEAASMSRDGQDSGTMSWVHHRSRKAAGMRWNRRSPQHAVADIGERKSERQD
jgi:hypothetical protein